MLTKEPAAQYVALADLKRWDRNPRVNDPAVQAVVDSIRRFGFGAPILARKTDGEIIAGHTRIKAAVKLGLTEVPVRYLDLTATEAHALALADNRVGEIAEWDDDALADVLRELNEQDVSLDGLGWVDTEVRAMLDGVGVDDVKWKEFDEEIGGDAPAAKAVTCPNCGEEFVP